MSQPVRCKPCNLRLFLSLLSATVWVIFFTCTVPGKAQNSVRIISNEANIYTISDLSVCPGIQAQKGDVFKVESHDEDWVAIQMFSGITRHIRKTKVEFVHAIPFYFDDPPRQIKLCREIQKAQTKAISEASSRYFRQPDRQTMYERLLLDTYILSLYRTYDIPATHNRIILDCVNDSIIGRPIEL